MAWYYFAFGKNSVNCFETYSCTSDIITATEKLILMSPDKKTLLTTVTFDSLLQVKNHLYVFDLTNDNDIVIIFPETDFCSMIFDILDEKKIQTNVDSNDFFKTRFLKPFCQRYLDSSSNEFTNLRDEIILTFEGLKEEDIFLNMLLEQERENRMVAGTMQPQASECFKVITISDDDDDCDTDSESSKEPVSNDEIIRDPLFEHYMTKLGSLGLKIYSSLDKSHFYQLTYDPSKEHYRCYRCKSLGKFVTAVFEFDEDGNDIVLVRNGPHKCTLMSQESNGHKSGDEVPKRTRKRKHSSSTSQSKTIRLPMYKKAVETPATMPQPRTRSILRNNRGCSLDSHVFNANITEEVRSPASKKVRFSSKNVNDRVHSDSEDDDTEADETSSSFPEAVKPRRVLYSYKVLNPEYVIRPGSYRFEESKISKRPNGNLIVTTPEGLEYNYCYERTGDKFRCARCYNNFRNNVTAFWCIDVNGEEFLELGSLKMNHKCTPLNII